MNNNSAAAKFGVFSGNFVAQQEVIFGQLKKYLGMSDAVAHKFTVNWACDIGRLTKAAGITISIGNLKKNREAGREIKGKLVQKGAQTTAPVDIADLLVRWEALSDYGLHLGESRIVLREDWANYISSLEKEEKPRTEEKEPESANA